MSPDRARGQPKLRSTEEAWRTTLLIPPPDLVPKWGQIEDSGDCCGFTVTTRNVTHWCVVMHEGLQSNRNAANKDLRPNSTSPRLHAPLRRSLPRTKCTWRGRQATQKEERKREASKEKEREATSTCALNPRLVHVPPASLMSSHQHEMHRAAPPVSLSWSATPERRATDPLASCGIVAREPSVLRRHHTV